MIFATVNLTIKEDESVCDENITLYRGDRNVQVRFVLVNNIFKVVNQTYAQMIIIRPSKESLFTQTERITNDTVVLTITKDMIDELEEVGSYTFQIRLYDDTMTSRITLPPCNSGLYVGEPIAIESDTRINDARINFAAVKYSDETLDTFDEEGNYNVTEWLSGDIISDVRMNKIENALYSINEKVNSSDEEIDLSDYVTDEELNAKGYLTNIPDYYVTDEELNAKGYLTNIPDEYVTDEELNAKGYLTNIPDEYVTDEELNAKGYLTEHQDLSSYATKDYVTEKIEEASINGGDTPAIDLSEYVTEEELNAGLATKIDNIEVNEVETTDEKTALDLYSNGALLKTIYFSGGGGSVNVPPYISSTVSENNSLDLGGIFEFVLVFNSSAMGSGTAKILINDIEAISTSVNQGENALSIPDTYFSKGDNRVTVYVIDSTGAMSNNLVFYVRYGNLEFLSYTTNASGIRPTFNTEFDEYSVNETDNGDGTYTVGIVINNELSNLPTSISFQNKVNLLTVKKINTSKVTDMRSMFQNCKSLTSLDLSNFDTTNVTNMNSMFYGCAALTSLDVSGFDTKNVKSMGSMFNGCNALTSLDLSSFDTKNVTDMRSMFQNCNSLTSLDLSNFDTTKVTNMSSMFQGCKTITSLDVSGFDTAKVMNMNGMFNGCNALTSLDLSSFDTKNVTNMTNMFSGCKAITSLDVSGFNTTKVTNMSSMFNSCAALTSLDVSGFDTTSVTTINSMFAVCSALTSLDLSSFDTKNVTNMNYMFQYCSTLTSLDLSSFDTSEVTAMYAMFHGCSKLPSLDLSNFDMSKVTNTSSMFNTCKLLMTLNVTGWPKNDYTQTAISTLPVGDDATNEIYATVSFTVPSGWSLINSASQTMTLRQTDLDNITDEEIAALVDEGWTIG